MRSSLPLVTCLVMATLALGLGLCGPAMGDILLLRNGTMLEGEAVSQTDRTIEFRFVLSGIWTTRTFDMRRDVDRFVAQDGDQSDSGNPGGGAGTPPPPPPLPSGPTRDPNVTLLAIVPLHGQVGGTVDDGVTGTFDASVIEACFEEAVQAGAGTVILDIKSQGGLVSEMEAICETILAWHDRLRIVAHTHEAYSAAAIITLCCQEVFVRPDSLIGAATIVRDGGGGLTAVEAKMASPHYARQRQYMAKSGHPYDVVAAMTIQETRLWWSPTTGFSTDAARVARDSQEVDGQTTILTMTADDALRWSIADGTAATTRDLIPILELTGPIEWLDLRDTVKRHNRDIDRKLDRTRQYFTNYFTGIATLTQKMNSLFQAYGRRDADAIRRFKREIPREVTRIRTAGNQIRKADRALISRRIHIPETFVDQIDEDAKLLGRIGLLVNQQTSDGWRDAADRMNTVVKAWREILGL